MDPRDGALLEGCRGCSQHLLGRLPGKAYFGPARLFFCLKMVTGRQVLASGTLLGSLREGNVIPWDGDADVMISSTAEWSRVYPLYFRHASRLAEIALATPRCSKPTGGLTSARSLLIHDFLYPRPCMSRCENALAVIFPAEEASYVAARVVSRTCTWTHVRATSMQSCA